MAAFIGSLYVTFRALPQLAMASGPYPLGTKLAMAWGTSNGMRTRGVLSDSRVENRAKIGRGGSANLGMWPPLEGGPSEPVPQAIASLPRAQELGTYEVLVVEDDPAQRDLLSKLFDAANTKNLGVVTFNVEMVDCGRAALETTKVDGSRFQLILLDLVLPDIAGQEVRRLPGLSEPPNTRVANPYVAGSTPASSQLLPQLRVHVGEDSAILIASAHTQVSASTESGGCPLPRAAPCPPSPPVRKLPTRRSRVARASPMP
jgi:CheY-like chemotaxis protein